MKRVFKRSELYGVAGWTTKYSRDVRIPSLRIGIDQGGPFECLSSDADCVSFGDEKIEGQPLINAIKALGYEVVDDLAVEPLQHDFTSVECYILTPEAAKVDTLAELHKAMRYGDCEEKANAIDAHTKALIQEAK